MGTPAVNAGPKSGSESPRAQPAGRRGFKPTRNHFIALALVLVAVWVVLGFGRTITQLNSASDRERQLADDTAALTAQLQASQRELELVQTDAFQALQARAYGIGAPTEIVFALEPGAPSPEPVVPLGGERPGERAETPLEAWLALLFGD